MSDGDTGQAARIHSAIAREITRRAIRCLHRFVSLFGRETTVVIKGDGLGGRNQEFSLVAAFDTAGHDQIVVLNT